MNAFRPLVLLVLLLPTIVHAADGSTVNINFAGLLTGANTGTCSGSTCPPATVITTSDDVFLADGSLDTNGLPKFGTFWGGKYPHVHPMMANVFDPVPTRSVSKKSDNTSFYVEKLWANPNDGTGLQGVYFSTDGSYCNMFVVTSTTVMVVDSPAASGYSWAYQAVRSITNRPVSHFIYSHFHWDHNGLASTFLLANMPDNNGGSGTQPIFVAHSATQEFLKSYNDPARPQASVTFDTNYILTVGGETLNMTYNGLFHETGNILIHHAQAKVLMLVDVIFPRWVPFERFGYAGDISKYRLAHDAVLAYDFDKFVGGHLGLWGNRADIMESIQYYESVRQAATFAVQLGYDVAGQFATKGNFWAFAFKLWDYQSLICFNRIYYQWRGILGGVDTWGYSHCQAMCEDLRINLAN